jgi:hypothetical protein
MEVQASGGQPTTTQSTETSSSSWGAVPKGKKDSYAAATVSTTGGEAELNIFDPRIVTTEMLGHYLAQVRDPTHVSEETCKKIMGMDRAELEQIQQSYLKNVSHLLVHENSMG